MPYEVSDLLNLGWNKEYQVDITGFQSAYDLVQNAVNRTRIALVQGPPGTGKTTVYESILHDSMDRMANGNPVLYIAPTNELVANMLERMATVYRHVGKNVQDLMNETRIYGSQFHFTEENKKLNDSMNRDVKLIITTEYQRAVIYNAGSTFHMMIDEASRSPLQRPFIALAEPLIRSLEENRQNLLDSISVIGDPKQAIALNDQYRRGNKKLLVMNSFIRGLLSPGARNEVDRGRDMVEAALSELKGRYFELLEVTRRLPGPSELPISKGYYDGRLRAFETAGQRLKDSWNRETTGTLKSQNERFAFAVNKIEDAMTTHSPMIYVRIDGKAYEDTDFFLYDAKRAEAGIIFAICLTAVSRDRTTVITTYTDQRTQMELTYRRQYRDLMRLLQLDERMIRFATVHKMLGAENDNIVAVLGKEFTGYDDTTTTIYFQEPELLNVQFSRHKKMITILGNLNQLITTVGRIHQHRGTTEYGSIRTTAEVIHQLAGIERKESSGRTTHRNDPDGCVYAPWPFS